MAKLVTDKFTPSPMRRLMGKVLLPVVLPALLGLLAGIGTILLFIGTGLQAVLLIKGLAQYLITRGARWQLLYQSLYVVHLLERAPGLTTPVGVIYALVRHPQASLGKICNYICGYRVGTTQMLPPREGQSNTSHKTIATMEVVEVNSAAHVVRIRGRVPCDAAGEPLHTRVLIIQHGGPGASEFFDCRGGGEFRRYLHDHFVVVDYDQRSAITSGCLNDSCLSGFSPNSMLKDTVSPDQHVADAVALCKWLKEGYVPIKDGLFGGRTPELYLTGGSWGSMLALRTAEAAPELFQSPVVVRGLVTSKQVQSERCGYQYIKDSIEKFPQHNPFVAEDLAVLQTVTGVPAGSFQYVGKEGVKQQLKQRQLLDGYGGQKNQTKETFLRRKRRGATASLIFDRIMEAMVAPEFSLESILGGKGKLIASLEIAGAPIFTATTRENNVLAKKIGGNLDVIVGHGVDDHCTDESLVEDWLRDELEVGPQAKKQLVWFRKSGHSPDQEEPEEYSRLLLSLWLSQAEQLAHGLKPCKYPIQVTGSNNVENQQL